MVVTGNFPAKFDRLMVMKKTKPSVLSRGIDFLVEHEWLVILLFVIFLLRIPTLFEPNWYGDEEIYLVMGQGLRKGLVFYRDIFDHKPPIIYMLAALVQTVFWFRMLLLVVHGISVVYFAKLSELLNKNRVSVLVSTVAYALLSTIPLLEGNIANGENFMTVPALIAMYLIYRSTKTSTKATSNWTYLLVGGLFSLAFLVKVPIGFDFVAGGVFWWIFAQKDLTLWHSVQRFFRKEIWLMLLGFFVPILSSVVYYKMVGAIEPYVRSALLQNIGYIESWRGGESTSMLANPLVWRMLLILGFVLVAWQLKKYAGVSKNILFLSIWLLLSIYGAVLSNRPYPHYLLQPLVPAMLVGGLLIDAFLQKTLKRDIFLASMSLVIGGVILGEVGFGNYPTVSYYKNFWQYATGQKTQEEYKRYFPASLLRNEKIATYIRERTDPQEKIFIWGEEPAIYDMADRLPVGRYIVSFHIRDFPNGYTETYEALLKEKPRYILVIPSQVPPFPELEAMLTTDYAQVETIEDVLVYLRMEPQLVLRVF